MKKNKIIISLSIITLLFVFGVAATCTLCGTPVTIGKTNEVQDTSDEAAQEQEVPASETDSTTTTQSSQSTETPSEGNTSPAIIEIKMGDFDLERYEAEGYFDELPLDPDEPISDIIFEIIATDEDGDELAYSAYDSHGSSFPVNKIDNNNAELNWTTPGEIGPYTLTIEVSDGRGGNASRSIEMNFIGLPEGVEAEDINRQRLDVVPEETGNIATMSDMAIMADPLIGDDGDNRYFNGYISFDITILAGVEVVSATLTMDLDEEFGNRSYLGNLRIGALNYGEGHISRPTGLIPAELLVSLPNSTTDISYSNNNLKESLQERIDASDTRFQLKLYWASPHSDDDGNPDALRYSQSNISMIVDYLE